MQLDVLRYGISTCPCAYQSIVKHHRIIASLFVNLFMNYLYYHSLDTSHFIEYFHIFLCVVTV